jgi:hypothetical protein
MKFVRIVKHNCSTAVDLDHDTDNRAGGWLQGFGLMTFLTHAVRTTRRDATAGGLAAIAELSVEFCAERP